MNYRDTNRQPAPEPILEFRLDPEAPRGRVLQPLARLLLTMASKRRAEETTPAEENHAGPPLA